MPLHRIGRLDVFFWAVLLIAVILVLSDAHRNYNQNRGSRGGQSAGSSALGDASSSSAEGAARQSSRWSAGDGQDGEETSGRNLSESGEGRSSWPENCTLCSIREVKRNYRLEAIKADILRKLRLSSLPNVTGRRLPDIPQIRKFIDEQYPVQNDSPGNDGEHTQVVTSEEEVEDSFATTLKYVLFAQPAPADVAGNTSNVFYFQFQSEMANQQIVNATISIYVRRSLNPGLNATWILIYRLGRLPSTPGESQERETMRKKKIYMSSLLDTGQWFTFDIRTYVERWISQQNTSYGIIVQVSDGRGEPLAVIQPQTPEEADRKPYLIMHVRDQGTSRPKRMIDLDCDENSSEKRCCRYPLTVDFEQFRWDWVIVPKRYSAYYCSGECPFYYYQRYASTGLAQQANKAVPGPCCSPRKVSAISMLYYDEYMNIVYGRLPAMVVDQCGCS